jgi:hypothetical protein
MYRVIWWDLAFDRMDAYVRRHPGRKAEFAVALRELTAALTSGPAEIGESRVQPYRVEVFEPLTVFFRPDPDEQCVYVVWVHLPVRD